METSIGLVSNSEQKSKIWKDPSVGRPTRVPVVPVDRSNPRAKPCQSVDRAVDRSSSAVDRAVDRYCLCTLVYTGRPVTATVDHSLLRLGYLVDYLSLSTSLHLGKDFSNLSRTQHRICRLESGCTSVAAYVPCPRDQAIRSSFKRAPISSCDRKDMEQCFTMCKFYS